MTRSPHPSANTTGCGRCSLPSERSRALILSMGQPSSPAACVEVAIRSVGVTRIQRAPRTPYSVLLRRRPRATRVRDALAASLREYGRMRAMLAAQQQAPDGDVGRGATEQRSSMRGDRHLIRRHCRSGSSTGTTTYHLAQPWSCSGLKIRTGCAEDEPAVDSTTGTAPGNCARVRPCGTFSAQARAASPDGVRVVRLSR